MQICPLGTAYDEIAHAAEYGAGLLREGKVIIYPTDTIYGLGADARNPEAITLINRIKARTGEAQKPLLIACASVAMARTYALFDERAERLAEVFLPGPLALVLPARGVLPKVLIGEDGTIGIRIPKHPFTTALSLALGAPVVSTSVNKTGAAPLSRPEDASTVLGSEADLVSCIFDAGHLASSTSPSTVVHCCGEEAPYILREGAISREKLLPFFDVT